MPSQHGRRSAAHHHYYQPSHPLIPTGPFHPAPDPAAYRDLLIFEERLKQAAARYARRKRKYQTLLTFLLAATVTSAYQAAAASPQWSGLLDLALRWAADSETDYRSSGLGGFTNGGTSNARSSLAGTIAGAATTGQRLLRTGGAGDTRAPEGPRIRDQDQHQSGSRQGTGFRGAFGRRRAASSSSFPAAATTSASSTSSYTGFFATAPFRNSNAVAASSASSSPKGGTGSSSQGGSDDAATTKSARTSASVSAATAASASFAASAYAQAHATAHADGAAMLRYYLWVALFLFFSTTTFLFFASGLYSERIRAGAQFVPQANRALRHYHLYLNTRTGGGGGGDAISGGDAAGGQLKRPALQRAATSWIWGHSSATAATPTTSGRVSSLSDSEKGGHKNTKRGKRSVSSLHHQRHDSASSSDEDDGDEKGGGGLVARLLPQPAPTKPGATPVRLPPPSTNPRGELLLSPRVHPDFRTGYERYRAEFERRRAMRLEAQRAQAAWGRRLWAGFRRVTGLEWVLGGGSGGPGKAGKKEAR